MPSINIIGGNHLVFSSEGNTLPEAVEAALRNKQVLEKFNLRGVAGSIFHGLSVSGAEQVVDKFMGEDQPRQLWRREIVVRWQAAQTLPQQRSGEINPIEDRTISIEHGVEFAGDPGMVYEIDGKQLVAKIGRPSEMAGGKAVKVYLDAESIEIATWLGKKNVSEGIRIALKQANATRQKKGQYCMRCGHPPGDDWLDDGETCPACKLVQ